jgi:hypothetical protein
MMRTFAASLLVLIACSSAEDAEGLPPTLEVLTPARGTFADADTVTVTGRVTDDQPGVKVTVAGMPVTTAADGTFTANVPVSSGIELIETHAIDSAGNDVRDVRAVLAGALGPTDGTKSGQIGARAGVTALKAIGGAVGTAVKGIDLKAVAMSANPIYNDDGCLGAVVNITDLTRGTIGVALTPKTGVLSTDVTIDNLVVKGTAKWRVACLGATATITMRATRAKIHGDLGARISTGKLVTSLPSSAVTFEGFSFDVGGVPSELEGLVKGKVSDFIAGKLNEQIRAKVPPIANTQLAGLVAKPLTADILGKPTTITVTPSTVAITPSELFLSLTTKVKVTGGEGGTYLATPVALSAANMTAGQGLGVAIDDDIVNQLLAGMWAADALEPNIDVTTIPALPALLDDNAKMMSISMALPPTVTTDTAELKLSIGDMIITLKDAAGAEVQKMALSVTTDLSAEPSQAGKIILTIGAPTVYATVIAQSETRPLTNEQVEGIVTGVWGLLGVQVDDALGNIPMPTIAGVSLGAPTVEAGDGFLLADMSVN